MEGPPLMPPDGLDRRKVTLAAEKAEMTHRQLQEALAREEAAHREHVQTHTRAVEQYTRTEVEYKQAQLQAMQLLHAIDAVVAAGGPPGQKDAELADVQRLLERTRDAHNEARFRLEEVNQSANKAKDAENADPNSHHTASAVKLAGATAMAAAVTAATLRRTSPAHPQQQLQQLQTPFTFTPQSAETKRERVLRPVGPANGAAGVSPVPYDMLPEGAVDGTAVVYASATPPANPAQMHMAQLELAKGRAEAAKLTARMAALEAALEAEKQRATALEAALAATRDEAAAAAGVGALEAAKLGAAATAQATAAGFMRTALEAAEAEAERERRNRAAAIARAEASHAQGVEEAQEANAITAELLKHARDLQREVSDAKAQQRAHEARWREAEAAANTRTAALELQLEAAAEHGAAAEAAAREAQAAAMQAKEEAAQAKEQAAAQAAKSAAEKEFVERSLQEERGRAASALKAQQTTQQAYDAMVARLEEQSRTARSSMADVSAEAAAVAAAAEASSVAAATKATRVAELETALAAMTADAAEFSARLQDSEKREAAAAAAAEAAAAEAAAAAAATAAATAAAAETALQQAVEAEREAAAVAVQVASADARAEAEAEAAAAVAVAAEKAKAAEEESFGLQRQLQKALSDLSAERDSHLATEKRLQAVAARAAAAGGDAEAAAAAELKAAEEAWRLKEAAMEETVQVLKGVVAAKQEKIQAMVAEGDASLQKAVAHASAAAAAEVSTLRQSLADTKVSWRLAEDAAAEARLQLHAARDAAVAAERKTTEEKAAAAAAAETLLAGALWKAAQEAKIQAKEAYDQGYAAALAEAGASATASAAALAATQAASMTVSTRMSGASPGSEPQNWLANTHNNSSSATPHAQVGQLTSPLLTPSNPFLQPTPSPASANHSKAAGGVRATPSASSAGGVSSWSPPGFNALTPSDNNPFLFSQTASPASTVAALCRSAGGAAPAAVSSDDSTTKAKSVQSMMTLTPSSSTGDVQTVKSTAVLPTSPVQIAAAFPASPPPAAEAMVLPSPEAAVTDAEEVAEAAASQAGEAKKPPSPEVAAAASRASSLAMKTLLAAAAQADAEAATNVDDATATVQAEAVEAATTPIHLVAAAAPDNDDHGAADAGGGDLFSPAASRVVLATSAEQQLPSAAAPREEESSVHASSPALSPLQLSSEEDVHEEAEEEVVVAQAEVKAEALPVVRSSWFGSSFGSWFGSSSARSSAAAPAEKQEEEQQQGEAQEAEAEEAEAEEVATVGVTEEATPWWHAPPDAFAAAGNTAAVHLTPEVEPSAAAAANESSSGMPRPVAEAATEAAVERGRSMRGSEDTTESDTTTPEHSPSPRAQSPDGWMMHTNAVAVDTFQRVAPSPLKTPGSDGRLLRDSIMHRATRAKHSGSAARDLRKSHSAPLSPTTFHTPGPVMGEVSVRSTHLDCPSIASAVMDMNQEVFATPAAHLSAPFRPCSPHLTLEGHQGLSAVSVLSAEDGQAAEQAQAYADVHTMRKSQSMNSLLSAMTASVPPSSPMPTVPPAVSPAPSLNAPAALSPACPSVACSPMLSVMSVEQGSARSSRRFSDLGSPHQTAHRPLLSVAEREEAKRRIRMNVNVPGLGWPFMLASNAAPKAKPQPKRRSKDDAEQAAEEEQQDSGGGQLSARSTGNEALWNVLKAALVRTATDAVCAHVAAEAGADEGGGCASGVNSGVNSGAATPGGGGAGLAGLAGLGAVENTEVEVTFVWGGEGGTMSFNEENVAIAPRQYVSLLRQMQKLDDARLRASIQAPANRSQAQLAQQLETQFASLQPEEQMRVASTRMLELRRAVSMASSPSRQALTMFDA